MQDFELALVTRQIAGGPSAILARIDDPRLLEQATRKAIETADMRARTAESPLTAAGAAAQASYLRKAISCRHGR